MSGPEIVEAATADANMLTGKEQQEVDTLAQVQELVNELHAFHRTHVDGYNPFANNFSTLVEKRMKEFLSTEGLKQLPSRERQEARLRILGALGLSYENARCVDFTPQRLLGFCEFSSLEMEALYRRRVESSAAFEELTVYIPAEQMEKWGSETCRLLAEFLLGANSPDELSLWVPQLSVAKTLAAIGLGPKLKKLTLQLDVLENEGEAAVELMGEAIALHRSLLTLQVYTVYDGSTSLDWSAGRVCRFAGRLLSTAFLGELRNTSINSLLVGRGLIGKPSMGDLQVLAQVLQTAVHITELRIECIENTKSGDLREFIRSVLDSGAPYLKSLRLSSDSAGLDGESFDILVVLLESNSLQGLQHFSFQLQGSFNRELDWPGFYTSLGTREMVSVSLQGKVGYLEAEKTILGWIRSSKTLQKLMFYPEGEKVNWRSIFSCLKENNSLKSLILPKEAIDDDAAYRELMEVLQVNSTLQEVQWKNSLEGDSREAAVQEALRAKARQESYLAELGKGLGQAKWQSPKCGRVFLCGSPEAGKTRLTRTLCEVAKRKSARKRFAEMFLRRTEGVEIHTLENEEDMQIFLWDLAGQNIFRAMEEFLFPRFSKASFFIFVFSPFKQSFKKSRMQVSGKKELKFQVREVFEKELLEWLRFIISNSAVTGFNLPQLIVVISHQDLLQSMEFQVDLQSLLVTVLDRFTSDFEVIIRIHRTLYFIDGHEPKDVKPILDVVYSTFRELFQQKLFRVPTACYQLNQRLVRWTSQNPTEPIIDDQRFFQMCGEILDLRTFSEKCQHEDDVDSKRLLKAVLSYLHDVGIVIDMTLDHEQKTMEKCNLIVVNPNWLTHTFLGRFIGFEQRFQLTLEEEGEWAGRSVDGFMSSTDFQTLLPKRLKRIMKQSPKVTLKIVRELMENLDLLYVTPVVDQKGRLTGDSHFFIPTFFKQTSEKTLQWQSRAARENCFLGVKLRCKDSKRTYLSRAFFSRFQVMIWRKFMEDQKLKSNKPVIDCKCNLIAILVDGFDILIQNDEGGDFIDVLIQSAKPRTVVWNYVEKHIVKEIRDFCASARGCPGVDLVMHIIRTECVKRLTQCKYRETQSVSREDLRKDLMTSVQNLGLGSNDTDLYCHTWQSVPEAELAAESEKAIELLPPDDVQNVYALVKSKTQDKVETMTKVMTEVDTELSRRKAPCIQTSNPLQLLENSPNLQMYENLMQAIGNVKRVGENVLAEIQNLKHEIQEMNRFHRSEAKKFHQKLDQLRWNSMSTTVWPKRPYFTRKDVDLYHRITARMKIGTPLTLHFECEADGHCIIPNQPGYPITVGKDNCEALRQISLISVQVIQYLLKAGLHVFVGMGDLVPQLETSDGTFVSLGLGKIQVQDSRISNQGTDSCSPEEAWRYLQDFLESKLKFRITECFLLHLAEYVDSESHAWLCQGCLAEGLKANKLKKL